MPSMLLAQLAGYLGIISICNRASSAVRADATVLADALAADADADAAAADGTGTGSGAQNASAWLPGLRVGNVPFVK